MSWARIDDACPNHRKMRAWRTDDPLTGTAALGFFVAGNCYAGKYLTDGLIREPELPLIVEGLPEPLIRELVARLVSTGSWKPLRGGWRIHDYLKYNPSRAKVLAARAAEARRKALARDLALQARIRARDDNRCGYCRRRVVWGGKGPRRGTFDHIDPRGDNEEGNLTVACQACNSGKRDGSNKGGTVSTAQVAAVAARVRPVSARTGLRVRPDSAGTWDGMGRGRDGTGVPRTGPRLVDHLHQAAVEAALSVEPPRQEGPR